jgi:CheY-like chemotaxis protein
MGIALIDAETENPSPLEPQPQPAAEAEARRPRLLVVDDDPAVRQLLALGLEHFGFAVELAGGGLEAIARVQGQGPDLDLVLLDVRMPDLDGPQTLAALRQINPRIRCCFVSGDVGNYTADELLALGAEHLFLKPFLLADVVAVLRRLLGRAD